MHPPGIESEKTQVPSPNSISLCQYIEGQHRKRRTLSRFKYVTSISSPWVAAHETG